MADNRNIRVMQFLDAYEKQPVLWNPNLESYKNKLAREEAYMCIIRDLNVPKLTIHDVKLKVKSVRTTYTKELRLLTKYKSEGREYHPKLFWFNRANAFLKKVSLSRDKRQSIAGKILVTDDYKPRVIEYITDLVHDPNLSDDVGIDISQDDPGNTNSSTYEYKTIQTADLQTQISDDMTMDDDHDDILDVSSKNLHHSHDEYHTTQLPAVLTSKMTSNTATIETPAISNVIIHSSDVTTQHPPMSTAATGGPDDEYDLFCRSVCAQLRSITDNYSRSVAKLKIQQILFEAETGHYRSSPCITIPVSQHISNL